MAADTGSVPAGPRSDKPSRAGKFGQIGADRFSLMKAVGGPLGLVESVLPYTIFSVYYGIGRDLRPAIYAALVPVVALALWRIVRRQPLTQAISGVIGVAIGAYASYKTGNAANFFLPNILKNVAFALLYLISIIGRWPLLGVVLGSLRAAGSALESKEGSPTTDDVAAPAPPATPARETAQATTAPETTAPEAAAAPAAEPGLRETFGELGEQMFGWRRDPVLLAAYQRATWLWVGLFVVRVAVQTPLWLADKVTLLGLLNGLVLGVPLFALTIYLSWLVLRDVLVQPEPAA